MILKKLLIKKMILYLIFINNIKIFIKLILIKDNNLLNK
jgi:hypothetical protein